MPIHGLTTDMLPSQGLPCLGTLFKGSPKRVNDNGKTIWGTDLDYFRVEFKPGFTYMKRVWETIYKPELTLLQNVRMAGNTPDEVFDNWYEEWLTTLQRRCNGREIVRQLGPDGRYDDTPAACLKDGKPPCDCKPVGRLRFILPDLIQAVADQIGDKYAMFGYFQLSLHGKNELARIAASIQMLYGLCGVKGVSMMSVPCLLGREKQQISVPGKDGKRLQREKSLVYLRYSGVAIASQLGTLESGTSGYALPSGLEDETTIAEQEETYEPPEAQQAEQETASVSPDDNPDFPF